eukprot:Clim_evm55s11 gene=Clim_evmTU55s11
MSFFTGLTSNLDKYVNVQEIQKYANQAAKAAQDFILESDEEDEGREQKPPQEPGYSRAQQALISSPGPSALDGPSSPAIQPNGQATAPVPLPTTTNNLVGLERHERSTTAYTAPKPTQGVSSTSESHVPVTAGAPPAQAQFPWQNESQQSVPSTTYASEPAEVPTGAGGPLAAPAHAHGYESTEMAMAEDSGHEYEAQIQSIHENYRVQIMERDDEIKSVTEQMHSLQGLIRGLESNNQSLAKEVQQLREQQGTVQSNTEDVAALKTEYEEQLNAKAEQISQTTKQLSSLRERVGQLSAELAEVRSAAESAEVAKSTMGSATAKLSPEGDEEVKKLKEDNSRLESVINELEQQHQAELTEMAQAMQAMKTKVKSPQPTPESAVNEELANLLKTRNVATLKDFDDYIEQIRNDTMQREAQKNIQQATDARQRLEMALDEKVKEVDDRKNRMQQDFEKTLLEKDQELSQLAQQIKQLEAERESLRTTANLEGDEAQSVIVENMRAERDTLRTELDRANTHLNEISNQHSKLSRDIAPLQERIAYYETKESEFVQQVEQLNQTLAHAQAREQEKEHQISEMQNRLQHAQVDGQRTREDFQGLMDKWQTELEHREALASQLKAIQQRAESAENRLLQSETEAGEMMPILEHQQLMDKTQRELQRLRDHLLEMEENTTMEMLKRDDTIEQLKSQLTSQETAHAEGSSRVEDLEREKEGVQEQLAMSQQRISELEAENAELQTSLDNLQIVVDQLNEESNALQGASVERLEADLEAKAKILKKAEAELEEAKLANGRLQEDVADLKEQCDSLTQAESDVRYLRDQLDAAMQEREKLAEDLKKKSGIDKEDTNMIDRRIVKNAVMQYFAKDGVEDDILDILAAVLDLDDNERKIVGAPERKGTGGGNQGGPGIGFAFLDFLLSESTRAEQDDADTAPAISQPPSVHSSTPTTNGAASTAPPTAAPEVTTVPQDNHRRSSGPMASTGINPVSAIMPTNLDDILKGG